MAALRKGGRIHTYIEPMSGLVLCAVVSLGQSKTLGKESRSFAPQIVMPSIGKIIFDQTLIHQLAVSVEKEITCGKLIG